MLDARDNSERLLAMVNNLLDLARLEQGSRQLDLQSRVAAGLAASGRRRHPSAAEDKGVEVVLDVPPDLPLVAVDAGRLGTRWATCWTTP